MRLIRLLKRDLAREIHDWVDDGVIEPRQGEAIGARYGIDYRHPDEHSFGYRVLVVLGYLFIGLSLITLIGANWEDIPRWLRTAGLVALVLAANLRGWFDYRAGGRGAAIGWFFLGGLFYGAAIMLIAQIYHLGEHFPDGILWWALGVLPFAVLLQSGLLTALMLTLAYIWFFVEAGEQFFPVLFPLFLAVSAYQLWRGGQSAVIFLATVAGLVLYAEYSLSWWLFDEVGFDVAAENLVLGVGLFLVLQAGAYWLMRHQAHHAIDYGVLLQVWVLRFFVIILLVFSFEGPWEALIEDDWPQTEFAVGLALACSALALVWTRLAGAPLLPMLLSVGAYLLMLAGLLLGSGEDQALALQVADNLLLIGLGVWLVVQGIVARVSHFFYVGVLCILLTGLLRYIDLVGNYIGAAILFAVFAAILLGAARFWKARHTEAGA